MSSIWYSFVPYHVAKDIIDYADASPIEREQRWTAVVLFADVSGFTRISEALASGGRSGSEKLTQILNSYFDPMIKLIRAYGGIIGKFGGDAMTVLFPYNEANQIAVKQQAVQCALDMQAQMVNYESIETPQGAFGLAMKAGLAAGTVFTRNVGEINGRLEYLIAGETLDLCAEAEHHAQSGDVILHHSVYGQAGAVELQQNFADSFYHITALNETINPTPLPDLDEPTQKNQKILQAFVHPTLAERLARSQVAFLNEHRQVTILFVRFEGFNYDDDAEVGQKLQAYLSEVFNIVAKYDGYVNKVDMGDKGSKYIILFGAPIGHEDDEQRALHCALEIRELAAYHVRIGINTGFVYCGQVGSTVRQEYTVMGDAVNLSARLMQASTQNQILVSEETQKHTGQQFAWQDSIEISVKGKTAPIQVFTLKGVRHAVAEELAEPVYDLPMVGRATEQTQFNNLLQQAIQGRGQVVGITAEAGMGKSRLTAELIKQIRTQSIRLLLSASQSYGTQMSYLVWQDLLRGLLRLNIDAPASVQIQQLEQFVTQVNPNLLTRLPVLSTVLGLPIPENDTTRSLDAKLRKTALENLVVACVQAIAQKEPLVLVFEDSHWLDPLSNELLEVVARRIQEMPILILVVYRPPETERIQPQITRLPHFTEMRLQEFSLDEARELIRLKFESLYAETAVIPPQLIDLINERAQGNPFYIDEMMNYLRDQGLDPSDPKALSQMVMPDSLHNLIISRIDRLDEQSKITLKVASVIGRVFRASWLWAIYPELGRPSQVRDQLQELNALELTPLDKPAPDLEYLFKHIVTREVAYETLAVATRQLLHGMVADYIEYSYENNLEPYIDLLAYHYGESNNQTKQRVYFQKAAQLAQEAYANETAVAYYQRLLPLLPVKEQIQTHLHLGQIYQLTGQWETAYEQYQTAYTQAQEGDDKTSIALSEKSIGAYLTAEGDYENALQWLNRALEHFAEDNTYTSEIHREIGVIFARQGLYEQAMASLQTARGIAEKSNDLNALYKVIGNQGIVAFTQDNLQEALSYYNECQQVVESIPDKLGLAIVLGNKGNVFLGLNQLPQAHDAYQQYLLLSLELGFQQGIGISLGNIGSAYWYNGDIAQAKTSYQLSLASSLALGDRYYASFWSARLGHAFMTLDALENAEQFLTRAIQIARLLHIPDELCGALFDISNLYRALGQYDKALQAGQEAIQIAEHIENQAVFIESTIGLMKQNLQQEQLAIEEASQQLFALLNKIDAHDHENLATIYYELHQLVPENNEYSKKAKTLYQTLIEHEPNDEFRHRYQELSGESLLPPTPLPALPTHLTNEIPPAEHLITQLDQLIIELAEEHHHHDHTDDHH